MRQFLDILRFVIVSPELVLALIPGAIYAYYPALADVLVKPMKDGIMFGFMAAALPLAMLVFNFNEGFGLLSPSGARRALLEWPDYPLFKARVFASFVWCVGGMIFGLIAVWMVATDNSPRSGVALLISGIFAASASTATIAIARFKSRELLGE